MLMVKLNLKLQFAVADADKKALFKICALFTNCISEINNTQVDNAKTLIL